jgi:hypothetical protein
MGRQSTSARQLKGSSSMLFGNASTSTAGHAEDAMSVDGAEKTRDGSVLVSYSFARLCCADSSRTGSCAIVGPKSLDHQGQLV